MPNYTHTIMPELAAEVGDRIAEVLCRRFIGLETLNECADNVGSTPALVRQAETQGILALSPHALVRFTGEIVAVRPGFAWHPSVHERRGA